MDFHEILGVDLLSHWQHVHEHVHRIGVIRSLHFFKLLMSA